MRLGRSGFSYLFFFSFLFSSKTFRPRRSPPTALAPANERQQTFNRSTPVARWIAGGTHVATAPRTADWTRVPARHGHPFSSIRKAGARAPIAADAARTVRANRSARSTVSAKLLRSRSNNIMINEKYKHVWSNVSSTAWSSIVGWRALKVTFI